MFAASIADRWSLVTKPLLESIPINCYWNMRDCRRPRVTGNKDSAYCLGFRSRGALGSTVIVKSHCTHFQVSSSGTDGCDLLPSMVILQRGQIFSGGASTAIKS